MRRTLFFLFLFSITINAQISPGDLTKFHSNLEGMNNCTKCHNLGEQVTKEKCLACHNEIKNKIEQNKGYHSSNEVKSKNCWNCHSEHNGRNFEIIRFNKNKFNHTLANFDLTGSHQNLQCEKCHKPDFIKDNELKKRKDTFLGLSQKCSNCHDDFHQSNLGDDCSNCHNSTKFRPAPYFDHRKSNFALTGSHQKVECEKCHVKEIRNGKATQKFKGILFKNCNDCHKDFHNGKLGNDCQKCHNTSSFNSVNKSSFDHSKTNYKLFGMHQTVECSRCHGTNLSSKPKHDNCLSCHKDYHKNQFIKDGKTIDCAQCHTEKCFSPSLYTLDKHSKTRFELQGAHKATSCKSCHKLKEEWNFRLESFRCVNCHENIHTGEIGQKFMADANCILCHTAESWNKVNFDHDKTNFPLSGVHKITECNKCHMRNESGKNRLLFASLKADCENCHKDVHQMQFKKGNKTDCARCHTFDNWKASKFEHAKTRFPLDGAHKNVYCSKCHKPDTNNQQQFINYKREEIKCAACHS